MTENTTTPQTTKQDEVSQALQDKEIENLYVNGFLNVLGSGDVLSIFKRNGRDVVVLNMSYTMAKTLALSLMDMIDKLETVTGNKIMTTHQIDKDLRGEKKQ